MFSVAPLYASILGVGTSRRPCRRFKLRVILRHLGPVYDVPPGFDVVRTSILIIEVVGVLPNVHAEDRFGAVHQRTVLVRRRDDFQFAVLTLDQPGPATAESTSAGGGEFLLKPAKAAKCRLDIIGEFATR